MSGEPAGVLETPGSVNSVDFHPSGDRLAAAGWDAVGRIWDLTTNQLLHTLEGHSGIIWDIAYSNDGSMLATVGFGPSLKLWDGETGREILSLDVPEGGAPDLAFTPDDRFLIVGGDVARIFLLPVDELMNLARSRVTRTLSDSECKQYLHLDQCPAQP